MGHEHAGRRLALRRRMEEIRTCLGDRPRGHRRPERANELGPAQAPLGGSPRDFRGAGLGRGRHRNGMDGYQAARGDGAQSVLYGRATRDLLGADAASTLDGQQPVADLAISNGWLQARGGGISGQYWTVSQPPIVVPLRDLAAIYGLPRPGRAQHPCAVPRLSGHPTQGDPIRTAGSPRRRLSAAATSKAGVPAAELCSMVSEPSG
jgi:hypothetical protein